MLIYANEQLSRGCVVDLNHGTNSSLDSLQRFGDGKTSVSGLCICE